MVQANFAVLALLVSLLTAPCLARQLKTAPITTSAASKPRALKATTGTDLRNHDTTNDPSHYDDLADYAAEAGPGNGNGNSAANTVHNVLHVIDNVVNTADKAAEVALIGKKVLFPWAAQDIVIKKVDYKDYNCDYDYDYNNNNGANVVNNVAVNVGVNAHHGTVATSTTTDPAAAAPASQP